MLLASCVNTPIDHNVFHILRACVARCSASCVNWALEGHYVLCACPDGSVGTKDRQTPKRGLHLRRFFSQFFAIFSFIFPGQIGPLWPRKDLFRVELLSTKDWLASRQQMASNFGFDTTEAPVWRTGQFWTRFFAKANWCYHRSSALVHWSVALSCYPFCDLSEHLPTGVSLHEDFCLALNF